MGSSDPLMGSGSSSGVDIGTVLAYIFTILFGGMILGVLGHWSLAVLIPAVRTRWQRYRTRRHLRRLLQHSEKFPVFPFDPTSVTSVVIAMGDSDQVDAMARHIPDGGPEIVELREAARRTPATHTPVPSVATPARAAESPFVILGEDDDDGDDDGAELIALEPMAVARDPTHVPVPDDEDMLGPRPSSPTLTVAPAADPDPVAAPAAPAGALTSTTRTTCSICLDDYAPGDRIRELPCAHDFHDRCLRPWLESVLRAPPGRLAPISCPVCRQSWSLEDEMAGVRRHHHLHGHHGPSRGHSLRRARTTWVHFSDRHRGSAAAAADGAGGPAPRRHRTMSHAAAGSGPSGARWDVDDWHVPARRSFDDAGRAGRDGDDDDDELAPWPAPVTHTFPRRLRTETAPVVTIPAAVPCAAAPASLLASYSLVGERDLEPAVPAAAAEDPAELAPLAPAPPASYPLAALPTRPHNHRLSRHTTMIVASSRRTSAPASHALLARSRRQLRQSMASGVASPASSGSSASSISSSSPALGIRHHHHRSLTSPGGGSGGGAAGGGPQQQV
ncbi:hypothetical protein H9P43_006062 [Blastocladiella emersonii ATCC 22665]|nr:hypothetical protein H9P43_006062 [Blastocladiella emersonii ATCC 22665]